MKGYKGFNNKLQCNPNGTPFQYEVGKEYETDNAILCQKGFHFCENPLDVFNYYAPANSRYCEVEGSGEIVKNDRGDTKVAASKIKIGAEIGLQDLIAAGVKFILEKVTWKTTKVSNDEKLVSRHQYRRSVSRHQYRQSVSRHQYRRLVSRHQYRRSVSRYQYRRLVSRHQYRLSVSRHQYRRLVSRHQYRLSVSRHQYRRLVSRHQYRRSVSRHQYRLSVSRYQYRRSVSRLPIQAIGQPPPIQAIGQSATNTGYQSAAYQYRNRSAATVGGEESVAISLGIMGKAKGALGCWLVLAEWTSDIDGKWHKKSVQCARVDGKKIKADTFYTLKGDKFVEMEENQ